MPVLLDTHTFLWFVADDPRLGAKARSTIEAPGTIRSLSAASHWEIAIKTGLGKLTLTQPFQVFIPSQLRLNQINILSIEIAHSSQVVSLPSHHRDPFDRLLIAQSLIEGVPILSADSQFDAYGVARIW